jgi:hypothetical protein
MKVEQLPAGPDTHCWDDDTGRDCWSYSPELVAQLFAAERERCIEVVMMELDSNGQARAIAAAIRGDQT